MLINLQSIHKPETLDEALALVRRQGAFPLYGGGAYLVRAAERDAQSAVDLSLVVPDGFSADPAWIGAGATLETATDFDAATRPVFESEAPLTLRNTMTLGDVLMETRPDSLAMGLLVALSARVVCYGEPALDLDQWFGLSFEARSMRLVIRVELPGYPVGRVRIGLSKVARTPADAPIVAALAIVYPDRPPLATVIGLAQRALRYTPGMASAIGDYKGSPEYRAAVVSTLVERALAQVH